MGPGATLFTRMPFLPSNCARPAVKLAMAPLVAAYGSKLGEGSSEFTELVLMIELPLGMEGNADCEDELRAWCAGARLSILAELPFQREAAHAYAHGLPPTQAQGATGQEWRLRFAELAARLREFAKGASHA